MVFHRHSGGCLNFRVNLVSAEEPPRLTWYEWLIGIVGFGLVLFTLQNFVSSFVEIEPQAAYIFLLITGLPALILLVLAWQLAIRRTRKA